MQVFHQIHGFNVLKIKTTAYLNPINDLTSSIVSSAIFLHFLAPVLRVSITLSGLLINSRLFSLIGLSSSTILFHRILLQSTQPISAVLHSLFILSISDSFEKYL